MTASNVVPVRGGWRSRMLLIDEVLDRPLGYGTPTNAWRADRAKSAAALFAELVKIEPRLGQLLADAQRFKRQSRGKRRICANDRWYGYFEWRGKGLKARLCRLVGEEAEIAELRTVDAYDVAGSVLNMDININNLLIAKFFI